jgi:hypothetical protein
MTVSFIVAKFIELILKLLLIACFLISTILFIFIFAPSHSIDFWKVDTCLDLGIGGWDYEERVCRLGLMK